MSFMINMMLGKKKTTKNKSSLFFFITGKRKVQGVPQSQAAALPKRKRKQTKPNKRKSNQRTKSTPISLLFPKRGNRNAKRTKNTGTK